MAVPFLRPTVVLAVLAVLASLAGALVVAPDAAARALAATPTTTGLTATAAYAGGSSALTATVRDADGQPVSGATVVVERRVDGAWAARATVTTDADGTARTAVRVSRDPAANVVRARYAGDDTLAASVSPAVRPGLRRRHSVVDLRGPSRVVDERRARLRVIWRAGTGEAVAGALVVSRRLPGASWQVVRRARTDGAGRYTLVVRPRTDTRWRVRGVGRPWVRGDTSTVLGIDNVPPGVPVDLPRRAPRPRISLPPQGHAVGSGAHPSVSRIPDRVWRSMTGRTWHPGCPVGRAGLRLVRVNYWDYDGYRRRGELVLAAGVAGRVSGALAEMYRRRLPIRAMYRVDRFGWSGRVRGGNDLRSMAAGNTSAFNCRDVVNRPGVRSPHSYGRALDLNTWENPYRSARGLVPNAWWQAHSHPRVAWRSGGHPVVALMRRHGLRWTYGLGDTQHFDAAGGAGRWLPAPDCGSVACE